MISNGVLARLDSKRQNTLEDEIKAATQRFDVGIVFRLSLNNKSFTSIPNLSNCLNLLDLNLSNNSISKIEGLEALLCLRRLNLASNCIRKLEGLSHLTKLEWLSLQDNKLETLNSLALQEQLRPLVALRALCLQLIVTERPLPNGCCLVQGYKAAVLAALPLLTNLDGERNPGTGCYAELSREMDATARAPPVRPEVVLPDLEPWFDASVTQQQPEEDWDLPAPDPEVEKQKKKLVKAIDNCHMLNEVFAKELEHTKVLLETQQPG